jgi:hypothetical protein
MFLFKSELNIYLRIPETPTALLRRRRVAMGAILGRFFKVLVLVPACALVLAVVLVRSADGEYGLLRPLLEFAVLITSLQIGYVFDLVSHRIPSVSERRGTMAVPPANSTRELVPYARRSWRIPGHGYRQQLSPPS